MADFPILEWVNINGERVPFTKAQHKKSDGGYVETGEDNPLPVADYGMTEGGVWIPRRVTEEGHDITQLSGSNVEENGYLKTKEKRTIEQGVITDSERIGGSSYSRGGNIDASDAKQVKIWVSCSIKYKINVYSLHESAGQPEFTTIAHEREPESTGRTSVYTIDSDEFLPSNKLRILVYDSSDDDNGLVSIHYAKSNF